MKNCWPANALVINNNLDNHLYNTAGKKLVLGRHTNQPKLLPMPIPSNINQQHFYNRTLNKTFNNQSTNCHYLASQTNYLSPSSSHHYLTNHHHQNKGRYFLLQNSNSINLNDNMYYTCYNNDYLKDYSKRKNKFSLKGGLFSKCRII